MEAGLGIRDTHVEDILVKENSFLSLETENAAIPEYSTAQKLLPCPFWNGRDYVIQCYWKAWELAFGNLRRPAAESRFITNFIDTAFNGCLFMWDSAFILMFGRYGSRVFNFQKTLDNLYARQHKDGYICRQLRESDGLEVFERLDPASTGPNIMPWCEWEYYLNTGDRERLEKVFPVLLAYTNWFRKYRSWPDGTYFSCGWGCGMDNQPRVPADYSCEFDHGHMSWIDTTCQQILANRMLIRMALELGRESYITHLKEEMTNLTDFVNQNMWNEKIKFYTDRFKNGTLSDLKSIGSFWAIMAEIAPTDRLEALISHLENPYEFKRPHRVPSLAADHPAYSPDGGYWLGAVWAPTNYMVLRGLTVAGKDELAHEIGLNHLENVVKAYMEQGTLFENYAPESAEGKCRTDFVGWTGLSPGAVLFEYVFGLRPDAGKKSLLWDVNLLDEHGIKRYPFGPDALIDLHCADRKKPTDEPVIQARSDYDIELVVKWPGGTKKIRTSVS